MPSTSETGHAVNVGNFGVLISDVTAMGAAYNPNNTAIMLAALITKKTACDTQMTNVGTDSISYKGCERPRSCLQWDEQAWNPGIWLPERLWR
jgi:hypothetical protein